jgi:RNA polymerase sigma-70 factor, ECF subfamily
MAVTGDTASAPLDLEPYRKELTGHCYRMLGSAFEADDAVQETMIRAWKNVDRFEGRSTVRSWVYRIATNVCLDMLRGRQRRALAMDLGPSSTPDRFRGVTRPESAWVTPIPDGDVLPDTADPAELAAARETIRLAFVTALQHLPPRQRAVLLLREVLKWQASEVAELLDTSVASVNSALQRARATLAGASPSTTSTNPTVEDDQRELLDKYVDAFERYDIEALVGLLHDDAVMSMPPFDFWLEGAANVGGFMLGPGIACADSRVIVTSANGLPAFASYKIDPAGGHAPWAIHVLELGDGCVTGHHSFLDTSLFERFGLPTHL